MSKTSFVHQLQISKRPTFILLRPLLKIASVFYGVITHARNLGYKYKWLTQKSLPVPVISVGNITAGGTGKTPMVIWLLQNFPDYFPQPILLSRGYGGDEKQLFSQAVPQVPHFTGSKRVESGQKAIEKHGTDIMFVLDDGFQHQQLARDLDIVLIDATCPFGYKHMLPRGFLREYLYNLKRADVFIITRKDMVSPQKLAEIQRTIYQVAGDKPQVLSQHSAAYFTKLHTEEKSPKTSFSGKSALLFCGIGNPDSFRYLVQDLGIEVRELIAFDDHYQYNNGDVEKICHKAQQHKADIIITTAKDAVKIKENNSQTPIWILQIAIDVTQGKEQLISAIHNKIRK